MTNLEILNEWSDNVQRYDITDPVRGGAGGQSNVPLSQLANRTEFLYNHLVYRDVINYVSSTTITPEYSFYLIKISLNVNATIQLDDAQKFLKGTVLSFKAQCSSPKTYTIQPFQTQKFINGIEHPKIWLCNAEMLVVVANGNFWEVITMPENHYRSGEDDLVRKVPLNAYQAIGQEIIRADHIRLFENIQSTAISELQWNSDPVRYKGRFSLGNGTTTMRLPDLRGLYFRALDLGRGISVGRLDNVVGGYEPDSVKEHYHQSQFQKNDSRGGDQPNTLYVGYDSGAYDFTPVISGGAINTNRDSIGSLETRVKDIGKIPIIYY